MAARPAHPSRLPVLLAGLAILVQGGCVAAESSRPPGSFAPSLGVEPSEMERTDTGLYVQTLRSGEGPVAGRGERVRVHYEGWFVDGTKFDSSRDRGEPLEVPIGLGRVIEGWDEGIVGMRVGELRRLVVPPDLAYGRAGVRGEIPPNATLVFVIELLGVR